MTTESKGLRFNQGKTRHDLVPAFAQEQYARVLTAGANKYAERNWELGMEWSKVLASMKRHILAFERGEDRDPETGELHMAHVMCNAAFLTEYYRIYPQGDNRPHGYLNRPRIGLDIDEVLADFVAGYCLEHNITAIPDSWQFDYEIRERLKNAPDSFWLELNPKVHPSVIPFEPVVYISSRPSSSEITMQWLVRHGFPTAPVVHTKTPQDKVEACKAHDVQWYVDDSYDNFVALNRAGICCFLMDAPHNRRYDVGYKRITSLAELAR